LNDWEGEPVSVSVPHEIVSHEAWLEARTALLAREKEFTRLRDELSQARRDLPWEAVEKEYVFDGPDGRETLAQLFAGRSQLIVYHFMFGPGWKEGCVGCSFLVDHLSGPLLHLAQRDVTLVVVSRAPLAELQAFRARMRWRFKWLSSFDSDFNYDFEVSVRGENREASGTSFFYREATGGIFHTYASRERGDEGVLGTYALLDRVPKGRDETVRGNLTDWVRHHDRYDRPGSVDPAGRYVAS
jgi:predicted dithiol-disulfide oxidoreductase (DUF899 family)